MCTPQTQMGARLLIKSGVPNRKVERTEFRDKDVENTE